MREFPRTQIEHIGLSRMIVGTNWFLGWSHQTASRDKFIKTLQNRKRLAKILEVFLRDGVDAVLGVRPESPHLDEAIQDAENRVGRKMVRIGTPGLVYKGADSGRAESAKILDAFKKIGTDICMPHQSTTDAMTDKTVRRIRRMDRFCRMIRDRGMVPGLSTHVPEAVKYADETGLDVATYIQIYNAAGFLMQIEIDWVHRLIQNAAKPVITIKPMAAGRLPPLVGLGFAWATIRPKDMVCVGTMSDDEAREVLDISWSILDNRPLTTELQTTRSKKSITG